MTGQKNKFKTTEKLWDLDDKQLKSPKHDAMVLWLMDKNNLSNYCPKMFHKRLASEDILDVIIESEVPIMSSPTFIAGYGDLIIIPTRKYIDRDYNPPKERIIKDNDFSVLIEVKPYIDSFGAVLRQIKSYEKFWKRNRGKKICLFTLDNRFDNQFESQDIQVLHPPKEVTIEDMIEIYGL